MNENKNKFMIDGWQNFENTGKISDYLNYKQVNTHMTAQNATEANFNAKKNPRVGNKTT